MLRAFAPSSPVGVHLLVTDVALARLLHEAIPAARLLARTRLGYDERDADPDAFPRLGGDMAPDDDGWSWDRVVRASADGEEALRRLHDRVTRQSRAARDEGALRASDSVLAALAYAVANAPDEDATLADIAADASPCRDAGGLEPAPEATAALDPRLFGPHLGAPLFEACLWLAARHALGPFLPEELAALEIDLARLTETESALASLPSALYPAALASSLPVDAQSAVLLDRAPLDALVRRDARELASSIVRCGRERGAFRLDRVVADLAGLLAHDGALVVAATRRAGEALASPSADTEPSMRPPSLAPASWAPEDWSSTEAVSRLAHALEHGAVTVPRAQFSLARGGDAALDAAGAEMLRAAEHPFASAVFAEVLARAARPRDIVRLVTYFAIAPDPTVAARALASCDAPELPQILAAWLESLLPTDDDASPPSADAEPESAGARFSSCVAALAPYPALRGPLAPLLARVSDAPPPDLRS
jgi:hypothetical protein